MSTYEIVVVSSGAGGSVMAAAAAAAGRSVLHLVGADPVAPGPLPDAGLVEAPQPDSPALGLVGLHPVEVGRAVLGRGQLVPLPMARSSLARLLPAATWGSSLLGWSRARLRRAAAELVGGGAEQRSYRDWVVQRFGEPAYRALHEPYARKRWGDPREVPCGVARTAHGWGTHWARVDGLVPGPERVVSPVRSLGEGVVETDGGRFEGTIWVDAPPPIVAGWLGASLPPSLHVEAARLQARDGWEVVLAGGAALPVETHLLDAAVRPFRLYRPRLVGGTEELVAQIAGGEAPDPAALVEALTQAGVAGVTVGPGLVRRLPAHHPIWRPAQLTRLRAWVEALEERGILPVGRLGLLAELDAGREAQMAEWLLKGDEVSLRDLVRSFVEPAILDPEGAASLTSFIAR